MKTKAPQFFLAKSEESQKQILVHDRDPIHALGLAYDKLREVIDIRPISGPEALGLRLLGNLELIEGI